MSKWNNPLIPDETRIHNEMDRKYEQQRAEYDRLCQKAIDVRSKAQRAAIELLSDARIKPYVSLMAHLEQEGREDK